MSTQSRYGLCQSVCGCVMAPSLMWLWRNIKVRRWFFCCCFFSNLVKKLGGRMQLLNCNVGVCRNTERAEMSSAKVTHPGLCGLCVLCQWFNWSFLPHRLWVWTPWKRQVERRKKHMLDMSIRRLCLEKCCLSARVFNLHYYHIHNLFKYRWRPEDILSSIVETHEPDCL